jgi:hypothetical protein
MKYLIAVWALAAAGMAYAGCTYNNFCDAQGRCTFCTTCCYGGVCNTTCN